MLKKCALSEQIGHIVVNSKGYNLNSQVFFTPETVRFLNLYARYRQV